MPFKVGDVVRLKTGGPEMTVEAVEARSPDVIFARGWLRWCAGIAVSRH
jgi:uncharacterized protein YodC (DUF2158 family)